MSSTNTFTKNCVALALTIMGAYNANAQVKIGDNPTAIAPGSALEVESATKGVRLTQVSLTSTTIFAPVAGSGSAETSPGMLVFNTNAGITGGTGSNGKPYPSTGAGVYYWDGFGWVTQNSSNTSRMVWAGSSPGNYTINEATGHNPLIGIEFFDSLNSGANGEYTAPVNGFYTITQSVEVRFNGSLSNFGSFATYFLITSAGTVSEKARSPQHGQATFTYPFFSTLTIYLNKGDKITFSGFPCGPVGGCPGVPNYYITNINQTVSLFVP